VALTLADARDCLEAAGDGVGDVGLIGGGARSTLWARMIAAAMNRRILRYRGGVAGPAFGAARLARIAATGEAPETVCTPPEIEDVTEPEPGLVAAFAAKRVRFQALYRALKAEFAAAAN
jgi:xylulokinase